MQGVVDAGASAAVTVDGLNPTDEFALVLVEITRPDAGTTLFPTDEADMIDRAVHAARIRSAGTKPND
ncbi:MULTISPECIES: hypothetical protein [Methylobacterium]|nr:hypothetical protein [Methylobacterium gregans]MDQ0523904.1 hypothetical protein [Methylobacterium gregans]GLS56129.1 hypothetical protein GCM10007886_43140 [Methylobacterium gregans]